MNQPEPFDSTFVHLDKDPEEHIGETIPDPWSDPDQTDWPMSEEVTPK
jgi:hypothetical protein